jgi:methyltransferase-like protein/2-polyprenyl-3-methyl-5-hydroxy-6-metoxy-1,4-benzoquinol methylase
MTQDKSCTPEPNKFLNPISFVETKIKIKNMKTTHYDEIPYTKHIYQHTQPDYLATLATLFGMSPPPVKTCRVLELGCASGINTLAMAQALPNGEFIGIDASVQQIKEGKNNIRLLGLQNIRLEKMDILDISTDFGLFDYIVAHGVYSWVPPAVRDKILQICHDNLQPNGVAYVSYNIYPGWHSDHMLREMLLYHTQKASNSTEKLEQAKKLLTFFLEAIKDKFDTYSLSLKKELQHIAQLNENYLFHEYLEENNEPVLFHEFIAKANQNCLQYVTDMRNPFISTDHFFSEQAEALAPSLIEKEQYMDFLRNNAFRETLLCHQLISLNHNLVPDKINEFYIAAPLKATFSQAPLDSEQLKNGKLEPFENLAGQAVLSVGSPLLKAVCLCLGEVWPHSLSFDRLMQRVYKLLTMTDRSAYQNILSTENLNEVKILLLEFYLKKIVELSIYPPQFTLNITKHPIASKIARLQSQQGKSVTNLRCEVFTLDFATRLILRHLDGKHERAALINILQKSIKKGDVLLYKGKEKQAPMDVNAEELHQYIANQVEEILQSLAKKAFLVSEENRHKQS